MHLLDRCIAFIVFPDSYRILFLFALIFPFDVQARRIKMKDLKVIKKKSAVDHVYEQMLDMIKTNNWKLGERIPPEAELARRMGVSRFTVRTAISRFTSLGIMETKNGEGTFVTKEINDTFPEPLVVVMNIKSTIEILELRRGIETEVAGLAARNATKVQLLKLGKILETMEKEARGQNLGAFIDADIAFHLLLAKISGNGALIAVMEMLKDSLYDNFKSTAELNGIDNGMHRDIFNAIQSKNATLAEHMMSVHLQMLIEKACGAKKNGA